MKYISERNLSDFPFWSGGERAMERISSSPDYNEEVLEDFLTVCLSETPTEGEINDFLWFNDDYIMEALGWREEDDDED
jgi:hypothetical protein